MLCAALAAGKSESGSHAAGKAKHGRVAAASSRNDPAPSDDAADESQTAADAIAKKFVVQYFAARPKSFLVDPQGLLGPVEYRERLGFLNYHASDSSIDLFVYVFKAEQEIPGEVHEEERVGRFFKDGRPAVVIDYFLGAPQRSVIHLSPVLTDKVPAAEPKRALQSSLMQAAKGVDPARQFEAFLVQMSIRIYWMEKMLGGDAVAVGEEPPLGSRAAALADSKPKIIEKLQALMESGKKFMVPAATCLALLVVLGLVVWLRRRARCRFPEIEVEPRLGGSHAAGVGAVISFASAAVPPASQREQMPDYLRR